jgi:hypothetical protein
MALHVGVYSEDNEYCLLESTFPSGRNAIPQFSKAKNKPIKRQAKISNLC